jgi:hypothetical protein
MLKIITSTKVIGIFLFESMPLACPNKVTCPLQNPDHCALRAKGGPRLKRGAVTASALLSFNKVRPDQSGKSFVAEKGVKFPLRRLAAFRIVN